MQPRTPALLALTAAFGIFVAASCGNEAPPRGVVIDDPLPAAPIKLAHFDGSTFELQAQRGKVVALYFGYTHCPDVCPTTLSDWARARKELGRRAERMTWVFISLDPERDTPEKAAVYARQFDSTFIGLSGSEATIDSLKHAWGVAAWKEGDITGNAYAVAHPAQTFVVDREGRLAMFLEPGVPGAEMARSLRQLF
jgi:protein SCO1/2